MSKVSKVKYVVKEKNIPEEKKEDYEEQLWRGLAEAIRKLRQSK